MKRESQAEFAAFVGLDWADATHDMCLQGAGTERRACLGLEHRPEAIDAWGQTLRTRFHGHPVAVGLELTKGPSVSAQRRFQSAGRSWPPGPFDAAGPDVQYVHRAERADRLAEQFGEGAHDLRPALQVEAAALRAVPAERVEAVRRDHRTNPKLPKVSRNRHSAEPK